jgi:hypothetical protein
MAHCGLQGENIDMGERMWQLLVLVAPVQLSQQH